MTGRNRNRTIEFNYSALNTVIAGSSVAATLAQQAGKSGSQSVFLLASNSLVEASGQFAELRNALSLHTPEWLWLSTAIRSLDHAIEGYCSADALGNNADSAAGSVKALVASLALPTSLRAVGVELEQLPIIANRAVRHPIVNNNPRKITIHGK